MKGLGSILFQPFFCLENLDLLAIQLAHFDLALITLFLIITF